jgi:hypothetical protein
MGLARLSLARRAGAPGIAGLRARRRTRHAPSLASRSGAEGFAGLFIQHVARRPRPWRPASSSAPSATGAGPRALGGGPRSQPPCPSTW